MMTLKRLTCKRAERMIGDGPGRRLGWLIRAASVVEGLHALRRVALAWGHPCRCGLLESGELGGAELDACRGGVRLQVRLLPNSPDD